MRSPRSFVAGMIALMVIQGCAAPLEAGSTTYFGFSVGVSNAPPPPRVVVVDQPDIVLVPGSSVYVVQNSSYDVFFYGSAYYCYSDGFWYRSRHADGPFVVVDVRSIPRPVLNVPEQHWKHHPHGGPPGQMKKGWRG